MSETRTKWWKPLAGERAISAALNRRLLCFCIVYALLFICMNSEVLRLAGERDLEHLLTDLVFDGVTVLLTIVAFAFFLRWSLRHFEAAAQHALEHEARFRALFTNLVDGAAFCRAELESGEPVDIEILEINNAFAEITHRSDVVGVTVREIAPDSLAAGSPVLPALKRVLNSLNSERFELNLSERGESYVITLYGMGGREFVATFTSVTKQKQAVEALRQQEMQLRMFVEHSPASIAMFDTEMRYLVASRRWIDDFNMDASNAIGRSHYEVFPKIPERWKEIHRRGLAGHVEKQDEDLIRREDGSLLWIRWEVQPWLRHDGGVGGIIIFSEDITLQKQARKAQEEHDARLRALGDNLPDSYIYQFRQGKDGAPRFDYLSAGVASVHGLSPSSVVRDSSLLFNQMSRERVPALVEAGEVSRAMMSDFDVEVQCKRSDGAWRWLRLRSRPRHREDGVVVWDGVATDITESKQKEESLQLFRALIDQSSDSIFVVDSSDGRILDANERAYLSLGYTREELLALKVYDISVGLTPADMVRIHDLAEKDGLFMRETFHRRKDGSVLPVEVSRSTVKLDREYAVVTVRDITARNKAEAALREGEAQLRAVGDNLPNSYVYQYSRGSDGIPRFHYVSAGVTALHGVTPAAVMADANLVLNQLDPEQLPHFLEKSEQSRAASRDFEYDVRYLDPSGSWRWLRFHSRPRAREAGGPVCDGVASDITEMKEREQALALFRTLLDRANDSFFALEPMTGRILDANAHAYTSRGYTREELLSLTAMDLVVGLTPELMARYDEIACREGHYIRESIHRRKDGSTFPVEVNRTLVVLDREYVVATVRDISERKKAEEERAKLATAIEQAADSVIITTGAGEITYVNPAFEFITGYTRAEVMGKNPGMLKSGKHDNAFYTALWNTLRSGKAWAGRITDRKKDGSLCELDMIITPVVDAAGGIESFVALQRDNSEQIQLERRLQQAQKLEAIGTLAGGIAHDFNNILTAICGYGELVAIGLPKESTARRDMDQVLVAATRATTLVRQILTFSRQMEGERQPVSVGMIAKEAMKLLRPSLPATITIHADFAPDQPMVLSDATQIHQIILNLCTNAYHAMAETGGVLSLRVYVDEILANAPRPGVALPPGEYVVLCVQDTGCGIPEANLGRIFDPFFTTKGVGQGTGLGLSTVHGIVSTYGGAISVTSEVGKGTAFTIYLPRVHEDVPVHTTVNEGLLGGSEHILVVDDEMALAALEGRSLSQLGYTVTVKSSSKEALAAFSEAPETFHLLLTDQTMPGMTGVALATAVRQLNPSLPVLICTGQVEGRLHEQLAQLEDVKILAKPMEFATMARAVRAALDAAASAAPV